jgi:membrane protease YdiL (CAAX protease family)
MSSFARNTWTAFGTTALALALTMLAGGVWSGLLVANLRTSPGVPWAVVVMGLLLWMMWQYLGGRWWPRSTAPWRKRSLRARRVPGPVFAWALVAGGLSIVALVGLWIVLIQWFKVQGNPLPDFSAYPVLTVVMVIAMASLVAATAEEAGFRGYLQGNLEPMVGGPLAILIGALAMEPGHGMTQGFAWPTMTFYLLVDVMFGTTAYLSGTILPGLVVHALGIAVFFSLVWPNDPFRKSIESDGADAWFWIHVAQTIVFGVLAVVAFRYLAVIARPLRAGRADSPV